jgi:2-isopropylmalate synthase
VNGSSADTDTIVASTKAYINALNKLIVRRTKSAPDSDMKSVHYKDH